MRIRTIPWHLNFHHIHKSIVDHFCIKMMLNQVGFEKKMIASILDRSKYERILSSQLDRNKSKIFAPIDVYLLVIAKHSIASIIIFKGQLYGNLIPRPS
jgi:hypothetical protein